MDTAEEPTMNQFHQINQKFHQQQQKKPNYLTSCFKDDETTPFYIKKKDGTPDMRYTSNPYIMQLKLEQLKGN